MNKPLDGTVSGARKWLAAEVERLRKPEEVAPLVGRAADLRLADRKPPLYLLATFKMAVPGVASRWQQGIEDLYRMRVAAVHPVTEEHATVWNEGLATNTQRERADYSVEGAERAVEFVGTVFEAFFGGRVELHPSLSDVSIKGRQVPAQMAAFEAALDSVGP